MSIRKDKRRRAELLRELSAGLGHIADELSVLKTPLPRILEHMGDRPFFRLVLAGFGREPLEALWRRAASQLDLDPADRESLCSLGAVLGRYDGERQAGELSLTRRRLDQSAARMEEELRTRYKNLPGLLASLGALLAILLL